MVLRRAAGGGLSPARGPVAPSRAPRILSRSCPMGFYRWAHLHL